MSAGVRVAKETFYRTQEDTWETQETATETEINMMKYAPPSSRQAYVDARANQLLCKANAGERSLS